MSDSNKSDFDKLVETLNGLNTLIKEANATIKNLQKDYAKLIKNQKKKRTVGENSGLKKPLKLADELSDFMKLEHGSERPRADVTKAITAYIREHSLQRTDNKRLIAPDQVLVKLLRLEPTDIENLSYLTLQKYLKHLFV